MNEQDIDAWFRFIGYGNPSSELWFIGSEEGGETPSTGPADGQSALRFETHDLLYDKNLPSQNENGVWRKSHFLAEAYGVASTKNYFLSNVAPLPKHAEAEMHAGIDRKKYLENVRAQRVPLLVRLHRSRAKGITVFHGKRSRANYGLLGAFGLSETQAIKRDGILIFEQERLIFTGHFSRGTSFPNRQKAATAEILHDWRI